MRLERGITVRRQIRSLQVARFAPPIPCFDATVFSHGSFGLDMSFGAAWEAHGFRSARLIQLAADPSRPSAGGAPPYVETSDVLCRTGSACARVPPLAFAASPPDLRQDAKLDHPRQIFVRRRRVRSDSNPKIRTPSTGRDAQPYGWVKRGSRSLDVCWTLPRTLSPDPMKLPIVRDGASEPCYRATPRFASRLPSALRERCFSPTSATDFS